MSSLAKTIKIVAIPDGEAPEEVRRGWLGCILPCEPECGHVPMYIEGVLSGPKLEKVAGFSVPQEKALAILEQQTPAAAAWFREHGFPRDNKCFRFRREETEVTETYTAEEELALGPIHVYDDMETGTMRQMT
jgi:hypothetical protein